MWSTLFPNELEIPGALKARLFFIGLMLQTMKREGERRLADGP